MRIVYLALVIFLGFMAATCNAPRAQAAEVDQIELPWPEVLTCLGVTKVEKVNTYLAQYRGEPQFVMELDSSEDGKRDILLVFSAYIEDGSLFVATSPSYIVLDDDHDNMPDRAFYIPPSATCEQLEKITLDQILQDVTGV